MDPLLVMQFWTVGLLLVMTPGADWAYVISAGIYARSLAPAVLGILAGYLVVITAVALGVGALVTRFPAVLTVLTLAGSAYLIWLGVSTLRSFSREVELVERPVADRGWVQFARGAGVSGINPKGLLLLLAMLPQFTLAVGWAAPAQMLVLGSLHLVNCAIVYTAIGLLARRALRTRPRARRAVTVFSGAIMILIGLGILIEQIVVLFVG